MKQQSKKIIENLLDIINNTNGIDVERIKRDLNSVLFMESVNPSKKFSMYTYCEKTRYPLYYRGVFHDPKGKIAVATDGHILCASKEQYIEKYDGKIIDQCGDEVKCGFPNWRSVISNLQKYGGIYHFKKRDFAEIDEAYKKAKIWASVNLKNVKSTAEKESRTIFNIDGNYFSIENIRKVSLALREFNINGLNVCDDFTKGQAAHYIDDGHCVLVMPLVPKNYEEEKGFYVVKL